MTVAVTLAVTGKSELWKAIALQWLTDIIPVTLAHHIPVLDGATKARKT